MLIDPTQTLFINSRGPAGVAVKEAPQDGQQYGRQNGGWTVIVDSSMQNIDGGSAFTIYLDEQDINGGGA